MREVLIGLAVAACALSTKRAALSGLRARAVAVGLGCRCRAPGRSDGKTSTMEKELNQAAEKGFRFEAVMGGETAFGGNEVVAVMSKAGGHEPGGSGIGSSRRTRPRRCRRNCRTRPMPATSTQARRCSVGVRWRRGRVHPRARQRAKRARGHRLVATSKTGTLAKGAGAGGCAGYQLVGMTVAKTALAATSSSGSPAARVQKRRGAQ